MRDVLAILSGLRDDHIISDIDLEFTRFLKQQDQQLSGEVLLAGCLASYLYRQGHVCVPLDKYAGRSLFGEPAEAGRLPKAPGLNQWITALQNSSIVGKPGEITPLILDPDHLLFLQKSWQFEEKLAANLLKQARKPVEIRYPEVLKEGLKRLFPQDQEFDWQKIAAVSAMKSRFAVISGGPGTGKTSTVIRFLALMIEQSYEAGERLNIGLAAPTGKAAARLKEAILYHKPSLKCPDAIKEMIPDKASTLHRLLGARYHSVKYRYNKDNPLPYDVVVVDEASMVDQAMMSKLCEALLDRSKLVLLGDKDQLSSVEAGSVLGDICKITDNTFTEDFVSELKELGVEVPQNNIVEAASALINHIVLLIKSYRFEADSGIGQLAASVNSENVNQTLSLLESEKFQDISLVTFPDAKAFDLKLEEIIEIYLEPLLSFSEPEEALNHLSGFKLLSAHRRGRLGTQWFNDIIEKRVKEKHGISRHLTWYPGRPVLITKNDYSLGLRNGDIGITMGDSGHNLSVYFKQDEEIKAVKAARLTNYEPAWAMTVHKSQGSEFDEVILSLPAASSRILTKELIYTAITRSKKKFTIWGNTSILKEAVSARLERSSGLKSKLWDREKIRLG